MILHSPRLKVSSLDVQGLLLSLAENKGRVFSPLPGPRLHAHPCLCTCSPALMSQLHLQPCAHSWPGVMWSKGVSPTAVPMLPVPQVQIPSPSGHVVRPHFAASPVVTAGHGLSSGQCDVAKEMETTPRPSPTPEKPPWLTLFSAQGPEAKDPGEDVGPSPRWGCRGLGSRPWPLHLCGEESL